ncbi:MAG: LacI family DNA-binding transcriptional regulator [Pseudomonadota bacterium]
MRKPTVHDIARASGYSLATVDRVLNRRPGVRPATVEAVQKTVSDLGYVRDISAANLSSGRIYRIAFILPEGRSSFLRSLRAEISDRAARGVADRLAITLQHVPPFDGRALGEALKAHSQDTVDSIILIGTADDTLEAEIERLASEGVPTLTLVSDLGESKRRHYIGIANRSAGRAAAALLGRMMPPRAKVAVLAGSLRLKDHRDRLAGFQAVLAEEFPEAEIVAVLEGQDDETLCQTLVAECLSEHAGLDGLYSLGAGNRGVATALSAAARPIRVIAHELTPVARGALRSGLFDAVLHQCPRREVDACIRLSKSLVDGTPIAPEDADIRTEIFLRDTMPPLFATERPA